MGGRDLWTRIGFKILNPFIWKSITLLCVAMRQLNIISTISTKLAQ